MFKPSSKYPKYPLYDDEVTGITSKNFVRELPKLKKVKKLLIETYEKLPAEIGQLTSLEHLYIRGRQLHTGPPPEIGKLKSLKLLEVLPLNDFHSGLTRLPPEIGELKSLRVLKINKSKLTTLPPEIGELKSLTDLDLDDNQFLKTLPPEIGELKSLQMLYLSFNQLETLPPEIGKLSDLRYLNLKKHWYQHPQLTSLPYDIIKLESLQNIFLFDEIYKPGKPPIQVHVKNSKEAFSARTFFEKRVYKYKDSMFVYPENPEKKKETKTKNQKKITKNPKGCETDKILNPKTNRCIKVGSATYKKLLKEGVIKN